jgi:hypothetical protein
MELLEIQTGALPLGGHQHGVQLARLAEAIVCDALTVIVVRSCDKLCPVAGAESSFTFGNDGRCSCAITDRRHHYLSKDVRLLDVTGDR